MKGYLKGFTLLELLIVVAIIGIVSALAIPGYLDYVARTQVAEAVTLTDSFKTKVSEFVHNTGRVPSVAAIEVGASGKYVGSMSIMNPASGVIVIQATMRNAGVSSNISGKTFAMASDNNGKTWFCGKTSSSANAATSIDPSYLPSSCK
ncbi:pilin [Hahella sp. HN01]|uniref:pilin n=1 Tax=unclassified Hahella TaxID=2624107 RepID=UPI001C1F0D26|nr:pilin [Hahella sp. HN01]MBU6949955.1 pilin [Hahella sp. HN01]